MKLGAIGLLQQGGDKVRDERRAQDRPGVAIGATVGIIGAC